MATVSSAEGADERENADVAFDGEEARLTAADAVPQSDLPPQSLVTLLRLLRAEFAAHAAAELPGRPQPPPTILYEESDLVVPLARAGPERAACAVFQRMGLCIFEAAVPMILLEKCRAAVSKTVQRVRQALAVKGRGPFEAQDWAFHSVVRCGFGRLDIRGVGHDIAPLDDSRLHDEAPWLPFVQAALGPEAVEVHRGVTVNYPASAMQRWRADGPQSVCPPTACGVDAVFRSSDALTIQVPLCTVETRGGGTEQFLPASHMPFRASLYDDLDVDEPTGAPMPYADVAPAVGTVVAYDSRVVHRSSPNERPSPAPVDADAASVHCGERVMLYVVYAATPAAARAARMHASHMVGTWARLPEPPFSVEDALLDEDSASAEGLKEIFEEFAASTAAAAAAQSNASMGSPPRSPVAESPPPSPVDANGARSAEGGSGSAPSTPPSKRSVADGATTPDQPPPPAVGHAGVERDAGGQVSSPGRSQAIDVSDIHANADGVEVITDAPPRPPPLQSPSQWAAVGGDPPSPLPSRPELVDSAQIAERRARLVATREATRAKAHARMDADRAAGEALIAALPPRHTWLVTRAMSAAIKLGLMAMPNVTLLQQSPDADHRSSVSEVPKGGAATPELLALTSADIERAVGRARAAEPSTVSSEELDALECTLLQWVDVMAVDPADPIATPRLVREGQPPPQTSP